jgi:Ca-activated chloride channel family protein
MKTLFRYSTKKTLKFGGAGALGACIGNTVTELFNPLNGDSTFISTVLHVTLWAGFVGLGISIALFVYQNVYARKKPFSQSGIQVVLMGMVVGGLAGGLAQVVFAFTNSISFTAEIISRIVCWGLFGLGVGWSVSSFVPNFPKRRALVAGFIGGFVGGALFRVSFGLVNEVLARFVGIACLGFCIGLVISYMEEVLREAWLTVVWGKNETTSVSLGSQPVILGSSPKADIYLPADKNYPPITAIIEIKNAKVVIENKINHQRTELKNGSRITMGSIEVIVNTKTSKP